MATAYVLKIDTPAGERRYEVRYKTGGRESRARYAGRFKTRKLADLRRRWVEEQLAAGQVPDVRHLRAVAERPTVAEATATWRASRIDVAPSTAVLHRVAAERFLAALGRHRVDDVTPSMVAAWIAAEARRGRAQGTIRMSLSVLRQVLDHAGIEPNPARDRRVVLPREEKREMSPPVAADVEAAARSMAPRYRLPLAVLELGAMRVSELENLRPEDVDAERSRLRVSGATAKSRRARWVDVPAWVLALLPAEAFPWLSQAAFRMELRRACTAVGVVPFGLHDLRHRRISLWFRDGVPPPEVAARAGHARPSMSLDVYAHVLLGDREVDWRSIL